MGDKFAVMETSVFLFGSYMPMLSVVVDSDGEAFATSGRADDAEMR
ncbi:MAG: hypothetical protein WA140_09125 [Geobacteraceae bacterium]